MSSSGSFALRTLAWLMALGLVALPLVGVMQGWFAVGRWPFRQLRIDAPFIHVQAADVRAAAARHTAPGFFAVSLGDVRSAIEALPWVDSADVRKRWPDIIEVRLRERNAAAIWQETELVDTSGRLFQVPKAGELPLPRFAGPRLRVGEVLDFYRRVEPALRAQDLELKAVQMSRRGGWLLRLGDGTDIVLADEQTESRLARYLAVQPLILSAEGATPQRVDLRYANGFAVAFRPPPPATPANAPAKPQAVPLPQAPLPSSTASPQVTPEPAAEGSAPPTAGTPSLALRSTPSRFSLSLQDLARA